LKTLTILLAVLVLLFAMPLSASMATPVTALSVTVSNGVATVVTSAAHNIPSNNAGFCIVGSTVTQNNICGTAASVADTTHFTVNSSAMQACASSCGTVQPSRLFLITGGTPGAGVQFVSYCLWTFTPSGVSKSGVTTSCASAETNSNLLAGENAALASGQWIEQYFVRDFPSTKSTATIQNDILAQQFSLQLALNAASAPGAITGKSCDAVGCN
jgi:hypothetical protein